MKRTHTVDWIPWLLEQTGAKELVDSTLIQNLWGGYGELLRLRLRGGQIPSVILKWVFPPREGAQSFSDRRKKRSYQVEQTWYEAGAPLCDSNCRVARCLGRKVSGETSLLLLEDLNNAGFFSDPNPCEERVHQGLTWLAHFHSRFLGASVPGLWEFGSYWHLDTRPQEWEHMPSGPLKEMASALDLRLKQARFQTLLHGDAKPPNFCWDQRGRAAAVDFQYVGGGCGIRDVALFMGRSLGAENPEERADLLLAVYFAALRKAMTQDGHQAYNDSLEVEWRELYAVAWSDYARFGLGWGASPVLSAYSQRQVTLALGQL